MDFIYNARVGVIDLNYKLSMPDRNFNFSLCNVNKVEDTFHFIAKYPIFKKTTESIGSENTC